MDKASQDGTYRGHVSRMPNGGEKGDIDSGAADMILVRDGEANLEFGFFLDNRTFSGGFTHDEFIAKGYFTGSLHADNEDISVSPASAWFTVYWFDWEFFLHGEWADRGITYGWVVELR